MVRTRKTSKNETIVRLTPDLMKLRMRVIKIVYDAHKVLETKMPWTRVRFVEMPQGDKARGVAGRCYIGKDFITINKDVVSWDEADLRWLVWHELGHSYFNAEHDPKCPLMKPNLSGKADSRAVLARALSSLGDK